MTVMPVNHNQYDCLLDTFRLKSPKEITRYFVNNKGNLSEIADTKLKRIAHWMSTGVWISEESLFSWIRSEPKHKVSALFTGTRLYRKIVRCEERMEVQKQSFLKPVIESVKFLVRFVFDSETVGAVLPSTPYLAKMIVSQIPKMPETTDARNVLEIGPGTGVFTDKIILRLNPQDRLDLVEFDASFCKILREKYKHIKNVHIFHKSILDHEPPNRKYDYIVSGLPLNGFSVEVVRKAFEKFKALSHKGTIISYFDYIFLPRIKKVFLPTKKRVDFEKILTQKKVFFDEHKLSTSRVMRNVPPARVLHHVMA